VCVCLLIMLMAYGFVFLDQFILDQDVSFIVLDVCWIQFCLILTKFIRIPFI